MRIRIGFQIKAQTLKKCSYSKHFDADPNPACQFDADPDSPSALQRENPALKKMKFINFFYFYGSFLPS
jgi:hypothetical protein